MTEPKGVKWMESEVWKNSQAKPKPRKAKIPGIRGIQYREYDEIIVTDVKMKFR